MKKIFNNKVKTYEKYGAVKLKEGKQIIDITTFRRELSYKDGKLNKIEYISNLEEDLKRRDFTINTMCIDKFGNIIDLLNGNHDIKNKIIRTVRDVNIELKEDPTRILRAIRFMSELDFNLQSDIDNFIKNNKKYITKITYQKRKQELNKLFLSKKIDKFIDYVKNNNLEKYLSIKIPNKIIITDPIGVWSQLEVDDKYPFSKNEKKQMKEIKELTEKGYIDKYDLYKKGIYISNIVADILKFNKKELNLIYTNLPIKGIMDIDINCNEICEYLKIKPSKKIGEIIKTLEYEIVTGLLKNEKKEILNKLNEFEVT